MQRAVEIGLCTCTRWLGLRTCLEQSQRRDVAQRAGRPGGGCERWGGSEKFSHGMVRSRKPLLTVPLHDNSYYYSPIKHLYDPTWINSIRYHPLTPMESIDDLTPTNKHCGRANKRMSKYTAPPNPQGDRPRSMRSLAVIYQILPGSLDCDPRFSSSPFNGVVTLRKGLARA
jgi:hypothetical protein